MPDDILSSVRELDGAFNDFRTRQDQRLDELAGRLDSLETKSSRRGRGGFASETDRAYAKAFDAFIRKGDVDTLRSKAMSSDSDADGGYVVPEQIDRSIQSVLQDFSPLRSISAVVEVGTSDYKKLVNLHGTGSAWVGETAARPETDTPQFAEIAPTIGELYANPGVTQRLLDDGFFNVGQWLVGELAETFGIADATAFVTGNGTNQPKGFLDYTTAATADGSRAFGTIEHIATGVDGGWPATDAEIVNMLIDVMHATKPGYRRNGTWICNSTVLARLRKLRDDNNQLIWQPGMIDGQADRLLGRPIVEVPDMPDVGSDSLSLGFGDFQRAYLIVDRMGSRMLRDPYTNKPYVHFYTTKRVGGAVVDSSAIKLVKFGLS